MNVAYGWPDMCVYISIRIISHVSQWAIGMDTGHIKFAKGRNIEARRNPNCMPPMMNLSSFERMGMDKHKFEDVHVYVSIDSF